MRAVLAPMVADLTFFEAIPGLMERLPPALQKEVESFRYAPWKATDQADEARRCRSGRSRRSCSARGADHPAPLQRRLPDRLPRPRARVRRRHPQPRRRIQGPGDRGLPALRHARSPPTWTSSAWSTTRFTVAHGVWLDDDDMKRLGDRGASVAHNPGSNMRLGNGLADVRGMLNAQGQCRRRHRRRQLLGQSEHVRGDAAGLASPPRCRDPDGSAGSPPTRRCAPPPRQRPRARPAQADRQDRAGLQGRHRLPRPAPHQLDPDQRSGERARSIPRTAAPCIR